MSFTETTRTSWLTRLKNGLAGLLIGPILVIGMIWLLSWNEGRSVATYRALAEGAGIVVSVDDGAVDPAHEGQLVHISGPVKPRGTPQDPVLGVSAQGAAGLTRNVDMYQWVEESRSETQKQLGGGEETVTTYSYAKEWRNGRVDSSNFRIIDGHQNPDMPIVSDSFPVETATIGAFSVSGPAVAALAEDTPVKVTAETAEQMAAVLGTGRPIVADGTVIEVSRNRQNPDIGDLRIRFTRQDIAQASFVGAQKGNEIADYRASNGRTIFLTASGKASPEEMFAAAQSENTLITWLLRLGGMLGMFIGFLMAFSILGILADVVPFIGSIVGLGTGLVAGVLTLILAPVVIAIAWIAYRPLLAIGLIAAGVLLAAGLIYLRRNRAPAVSTTAAPAGQKFGR